MKATRAPGWGQWPPGMTPWGVWRGGESCWPTSAASATLISASSKSGRSDFCQLECINVKPDQSETVFPSYSLLKDTGWSPYGSPAVGGRWCTQDLMRVDLKPVNSFHATRLPDNQATKKHPHFQMLSMQTSSRWTKSSKWALKKPVHKHSSSLEVILSLAAMTTHQGLCYSVICVICSCAGVSIIQTQARWPAWWHRLWRTRVLRERPSCKDRLCCRWLVHDLFHTRFESHNPELLKLWLFYRRSWTVATAAGLCSSQSQTPKFSAASCGLGSIG